MSLIVRLATLFVMVLCLTHIATPDNIFWVLLLCMVDALYMVDVFNGSEMTE